MNPGRLSTFASAALLGLACFASTGALATGAQPVTVVQYAHRHTGHVFMTAFADEIDSLDAAAEAGDGQWFRNWRKFRASGEPGVHLAPVCRFLRADGSAAAHFFTAFAEECAALMGDPSWIYEGIAFHAELPDAGGRCAPGNRAVYRAYHVTGTGDSHHTYTLSMVDEDAGQEAGMATILEGVAWCTPREGAAEAREDYVK
jgi:serine protease